MEAYTSFAQVYDMFMDNVPYDSWCEYLKTQLDKYGITTGTLLELGCGTGKMTRRMAQAGYEMIGLDNSMEMLEIAMEREAEVDSEEEADCETATMDLQRQPLYLLQDMREFELYGTVNAVISVCDCLNYILDEEGLFQVFERVSEYLEPQGVFVFDMNTLYKYEELLAENTFAENRDTGSFIWENYYDPRDKINEYDLTLFIAEQDGRFSRFQEQHYQRGYSLDTIKELLGKAGLEFLAAYDGYTESPLTKKSERMTVIAGKMNITDK